jgi:hypothetical protein
LIESYDFGVMVVNGKRYTSDVIVFLDRVIDDWWRKEGHRLYVEDLKEILGGEQKPEVLLVGTGYYGIMKISPEVEKVLKSQGIELVVKPTTEAWQTFNELLASGRRVAGAFHLTC